VSLNWRDDLETLHIACAFDAKVPDKPPAEVYRLVAQINEQLWLGHFDVWIHEGLIMFRQGLMLNGTLATPHQCEALLKAGLEACERYYQAFQFVVWAGKDSREALASTMFETEGPGLKAGGPCGRSERLHRSVRNSVSEGHFRHEESIRDGSSFQVGRTAGRAPAGSAAAGRLRQLWRSSERARLRVRERALEGGSRNSARIRLGVQFRWRSDPGQCLT